MRSKLFPIAILLLATFSCKKNDPVNGGDGDDGPPQPPINNNQAVSWTKNYGGTKDDKAYASVQLSSGEYIMAGQSRSVDGDVPGTRVSWDSWVMKIDPKDGTKQWSNVYGNGSDDEYPTGVVQASDGNIIITGYSYIPGTNPYHAWALKINSSGAKIWEKKLTTGPDAQSLGLVATSDGGAILVGYESGNGGRNGWMVKIDANGNSSWKKTFGGGGEDQLTGIIKASDEGYLVSGFTASTDGDITQNKGSYDAWLLKVDGSGNKVWSATFGGTADDRFYDLATTTDGKIVAVGQSTSKDGIVPGNRGGVDGLIVKMDGTGTLVWAKNYGGRNDEYVNSVVSASNGGVVFMGYTNSSTGDVTRTDNDFGAWLLKLDESGAKIGASTYGARTDEKTYNLISTNDGGYLVTGEKEQKTATTREYDAWLVKIAAL